jgi:hypothetical protein
LLACFSALASCSTSESGLPPRLDAGHAGTTSGCHSAASTEAADGGFSLPLAPCIDPASLGPGQLLLTASGEELALRGGGYAFPARNAGDPVFADGWAVSFDHVLATFDQVSLWESPDLVPTDQSQHGALVAEADGPWAIDLSSNGPSFPYVDGKETGERAVAFAVMTSENRNGGAPFPTDGTRLAVGFSLVVATPAALDVNLGAPGLALYQRMVADGCVVLYTGSATWHGDEGLCTGAPALALPKVVRFDLCFKPRTGSLQPGDVETRYVNCDNQDNDGPGPNGEPHPRGVAFKPNTYVTGEVTIHTDHPFWESTQHDTPAHFDQFAARVAGVDGGVPMVHFEQMAGVDYTGFEDALGNVVPWRICDPNYQNPNGGSRVGQMAFDPTPAGVTHCANGNSSNGFCDYEDFAKYDQSTQGHWSGADGLCFVERAYPSPR